MQCLHFKVMQTKPPNVCSLTRVTHVPFSPSRSFHSSFRYSCKFHPYQRRHRLPLLSNLLPSVCIEHVCCSLLVLTPASFSLTSQHNCIQNKETYSLLYELYIKCLISLVHDRTQIQTGTYYETDSTVINNL